jgi:hypothetical protein
MGVAPPGERSKSPPIDSESRRIMSVISKRKKLAAVTAAALSSIGLIIVAPPAQACQMVGPACKDPMPDGSNCSFNGVQVIVADDGTANTPAEKDLVLPTNGTLIAGDAALTNPQVGQSKGTASGAISGTQIQFIVNWTSGPLNTQSSRYNGKVYGDHSAGGTADPNVGIQWYTKFNDRIQCTVPPPVVTTTQPPAQATAAAGRTVTGDVDLYDKPGGDGKVIGRLNNGDAVSVNGAACPMNNPNNAQDATNGWCLVTDTTLKPNRTGAVWGDFISK